MKHRIATITLCLLVAAITGRVAAQDGWYLRTNLGFAVAPGLTIDARDNDWGTKCDKLSNPGLAETGPNDCLSAPPPAQWTHEVGRGSGVQSVLALGFSWNDLRFEGEYLYRTSTHKQDEGELQVLDVVTQEKQQQELETLEGGLEDLMAHSFFVNAYYDFRSDSPFTPYVGIGVGVARTSLDYYGRFQRNDDPAAISTFEDPLLKARLAGTTTVGRHKMNDLLAAYQAVAGVDYALSDKVGIGARFRWSKFSEFDDEKPWTQLRSHASSVGRGFDVMYGVSTSGLMMIGASLNMKYSF
ncbi:MAG: outer membrane beta-barrel protein [Gemmatimonadetes bacterium]|nr:outer membrane beta-barrel protein [Gemmatimonadota bacterium]